MQVTQRFAQLLTKNVGKVMVGKESAVELMMIALLCRGHVLIEDVPVLARPRWPARWRVRWIVPSSASSLPRTSRLRTSPAFPL